MILVGVGLAMENGNVLLCRRSGDRELTGWWELPGGKVEGGESIQECIRREIHEELQSECVVTTDPVVTIKAEYYHGTFCLYAHRIILPGTTFKLTAHSDTAWVQMERVVADAHLKILPSNRHIIQQLMKSDFVELKSHRPTR